MQSDFMMAEGHFCPPLPTHMQKQELKSSSIVRTKESGGIAN